MRTSRILLLATTVLVALAGCATEPVETGGPDRAGTSTGQQPFEREVTPTETDDDTDNVADPERQTTEFDGSIAVSEHTTDGTYVAVDAAEIVNTDGWLVIHASEDGAPGVVLGKHAMNSDLETKQVTDLRVELDEPLPAGEQRVWVMLHIDAGEGGVYEFPGPDEPLAVDGAVVQTPVKVHVEPAA